MPIWTKHPDYEETEKDWTIVRDVLAGERRLQERGEVYLEKLSGQDGQEYDRYQKRASLFNALARTKDGLVGMIFLKPPAEILGGTAESGDARGTVWSSFKEDTDLQGTTSVVYARDVVAEVVTTGRAGTLIDWNESDERSYVTMYEGVDILNWRVGRVRGRLIPTLITLREFVEKPLTAKLSGQSTAADEFDTARVQQIRVLKLGATAGQDAKELTGEAVYSVEVWQEIEVQEDMSQTKESIRNRKSSETRWERVSQFVPTRKGEKLTEIPFVFHGISNSRPHIGRIPLLDLARKNLDHYRLSTQLRHGLWFTALPTAVISDDSFDANCEMRIGSATAWKLSKEGKAWFLEFNGDGLGAIRDTINDAKGEMEVVGARLLETQKKAAEAAETQEIRQSGETSVLADISATISEGLTRVYQWIYWWEGGADVLVRVSPDEAAYSLNTDFINKRMKPDDALAMGNLWQARIISKETLFHNLKLGEIIPPDVTYEFEEERIGSGEDQLLGFNRSDAEIEAEAKAKAAPAPAPAAAAKAPAAAKKSVPAAKKPVAQAV